MARDCPLTGEAVDQCGCRSCEPDEPADDQPTSEAWRMVPFLPLPGAGEP
jgi:hypothetical protein